MQVSLQNITSKQHEVGKDGPIVDTVITSWLLRGPLEV